MIRAISYNIDGPPSDFYISPKPKKEEFLKTYIKYTIPYCVAAVCFKALHDLALTQPADALMNYTTTAMNGCITLSIFAGALHCFHEISKGYENEKEKEITHILVNAEQYNLINKEITRLKEENFQLKKDLEEAERKLNFTPLLNRLT